MIDVIPTNANFNKWFEIGVTIVAILSGVIFSLFKIKKKKDTYFEHHSKIYEFLTELRIKTNAARAQIVRFHNGEYFMDGISMRKMSLTHESLNPAISSEVDKKQNLQLSLFVPLINNIIAEKDILPTLRIVNTERDSYSKNYMETSHVYAYMAVPILNKNTITGYIMIHWCSLFVLDKIDEKQCSNDIKKISKLIEIELSLDATTKI